ncbi:hypothetical protein B5G09_03965 [Alistipes sp. An54]|uniref:M15 family metallopeptidase n=1 Tax=Alistipes sp. An54 TaxID=1965645 RepID=UPI000B3A288B|nr:M15 family metallopeptidase [Alistipes sp. An54]OUN77988.1 hypothetical protein B5G09_03965 [Alistipes sp. An54]
MKNSIKNSGLIILGILLGWGISHLWHSSGNQEKEEPASFKTDRIDTRPATAQYQDTISLRLKRYGLIDIQNLDSSILVKLAYATPDNFTKSNLYGNLNRAYLEPGFAHKVAQAQKELHKQHPQYTILIWDASRPISVQRKMRKIVEGTKYEKYVANGDRGGRHNYGVAVDLTIADSLGNPLDMGTPFDYFGDAAHVGNEDQLVNAGIISSEARQNRQLLYQIMKKAGLIPYRREWWHYEEPIPMSEVRKKYLLLDF